MTILYVISFALLVLAIALFLELNPERIARDIIAIVSPNVSLKEEVSIAQKRKRKKSIGRYIVKIKDSLEAAGKKGVFATVCVASIVLMITGCVIAVIINNYFLIPTLCIICAITPFLYAQSLVNAHDRHIKDELETTLAIITTSYIRTDDIISAVKENLMYFKPPMDTIFKEFVVEATLVRSDIKLCIKNLQTKIESDVFDEWCESLIACQDDRSLKDTLLAIVAKLTDIRIVNNDLKTIASSAKMEYWTMAALVVGAYPLLYLVNKDWFETLVETNVGKIITAVVCTILFIFTILMFKYTKPIEYKK